MGIMLSIALFWLSVLATAILLPPFSVNVALLLMDEVGAVYEYAIPAAAGVLEVVDSAI